MKKSMLFIVAVVTALSSFAQKDKMQKADTAVVIKAKYICPMHPDVTSDKPGKCTKCGMDLVLSKKHQMKMDAAKMYTCPMHPDVVSNKPGKCSKCGMDLTVMKSKKEGMKMDAMKMYVCPMHPDEKSDKPGKCSKCGMDLKKVVKAKNAEAKDKM
ncbi:MAG: hypothetical protein JST86_15805 [Bacteroidetes bacterium]|nr:hypothetical protein [Bacteroidota bacterium]